MTDPGTRPESDWVPVLRDFARASGHELRNALNGLVVNLEVVRARSATLDDSTQPFLAQAIDQADQTARLAEGTIALLNTIVAAIDAEGSIKAGFIAPRGVKIEVSPAEAERAARSLSTLSDRTDLTADASGGTVILSIPEGTPDSK